MRCPKCGSGEEQLDFWIADGGIWMWNCFECEHEWQVTQEEMKKDKDE